VRNVAVIHFMEPRAANSSKSADPNLNRESPHLKIRRNALGDFKN
jgi:hypothetical protein